MKTIIPTYNLAYYKSYLKRIFGFFYTKDLYTQYKNIGKYTYGFPQIIRFNKESKIKIGKFCSIANGVKIFLDGEHETKNISTYPFGHFKDFKTKSKPKGKSKGTVKIGNDVWIGYGVTILSGITIGDGAVIGARSLVVKNIPEYSIAGGVPAKIIRKRFSDNEIKKLLKIKWWNWPHQKIQQHIHLINGCDVKNFIKKFE